MELRKFVSKKYFESEEENYCEEEINLTLEDRISNIISANVDVNVN